jgi:hypothetical protein
VRPQGPASPLSAIAVRAGDAGAGVDPGGWRLAVDGIDVTGAAEIGSGGIVLRPLRPWGAGEHVVRVTAADRSGNRTVRTWTFALPVVPPRPPEAPQSAGAAPAPPVLQRPTVRLVLHAARMRLRAGGRTVLRGTATGTSSLRVRIEARVGASWRLVVAVPIDGDGAFSTPVQVPIAGGYDVRARIGDVRSRTVRLVAR